MTGARTAASTVAPTRTAAPVAAGPRLFRRRLTVSLGSASAGARRGATRTSLLRALIPFPPYVQGQVLTSSLMSSLVWKAPCMNVESRDAIEGQIKDHLGPRHRPGLVQVRYEDKA